jgi:hypothetical protein
MKSTHVRVMEELIRIYTMLTGKYERKIQLAMPMKRLEDNIKHDL